MWNLNKYESNVALIDDSGNKLTYSQLEHESNEIFNVIGKRSLIFLLCSNTIGSIIGYTSFINHNIVPVMLNASLNKELLCNLLNLYKPSFLWIPDKNVKDFESFTTIYSSWEYSLLKTNYNDSYPLFGNLALLLTTSGSTGSPKFVRQSYENIRSNLESIVDYLKLNSDERPITTLPMNYTYGLSIINTHLEVGATILLTEKTLVQKEFWQFFKENEATSIAGVPYTYEMLDRLRFYRMNLPSLKTLTQAGGKLTPELHEKFAKYALETNRMFVVMYGQCEATARMGYLPADKAIDKKGSMGIAIPGGKLKLVDSNGDDIVRAYTTGELVYEGKNVTLGYAEQGADLIKADERKGILFTGDMAEFDEDGYFYIVGRKKRFLKLYGNRVNLDEIERLIKSKFNIEVACGGVDDSVSIFVNDDSVSEKVKEFISSITNINHKAFKIVTIDEIPKNDSGKIKYKELEKYYK